MTVRTSPWPTGVPCWTNLTARDVSAAQAFYGAVLGWTYSAPAEEFGGYVVATVDGYPAAGIAPVMGGAPGWTVFIASDDVDKTAAAVNEHGGTLVFPPDQVGPLGRMIAATDPTGAAFGVWEHGEHIGAGVYNEPGGLTWEDLRSSDPDAARAFYTAVFGYETQGIPEAGPDYATFSLPGGEPMGGIGGMMGREGIASHWLPYFGVRDLVAAVADAESKGGAVHMRDFETPYGRMAALADPEGSAFWVVEVPPRAES